MQDPSTGDYQEWIEREAENERREVRWHRQPEVMMSVSTDYHSDFTRVSKTMLNHFARSTQEYWHYYVEQDMEPPPPKRHMEVGSAVHEILLERANPWDRIAVYPDSCLKSNRAINPKPAREFEAANEGRYVLKEADAALVLNACEAVREHELGELIGNERAVFEQSIFWRCPRTGLDCRAKPDFFVDMGDRVLAYDLKTTEQIYPAAFRRTARTLRYWLQDAHYSAGLAENFGKPVEFRFWLVEVAQPFRISPREYDPRSREIAAHAYHQLMERLASCYESGEWRDDWTRKVTYLTVDPWDVDFEDELEFEDAA